MTTEAKCVLSVPMLSALSNESQYTMVNDQKKHLILFEIVTEKATFFKCSQQAGASQ